MRVPCVQRSQALAEKNERSTFFVTLSWNHHFSVGKIIVQCSGCCSREKKIISPVSRRRLEGSWPQPGYISKLLVSPKKLSLTIHYRCRIRAVQRGYVRDSYGDIGQLIDWAVRVSLLRVVLLEWRLYATHRDNRIRANPWIYDETRTRRQVLYVRSRFLFLFRSRAFFKALTRLRHGLHGQVSVSNLYHTSVNRLNRESKGYRLITGLVSHAYTEVGFMISACSGGLRLSSGRS
ncbi:hypothetical protein V8E53_006165 [Lactarius tabidus]